MCSLQCQGSVWRHAAECPSRRQHTCHTVLSREGAAAHRRWRQGGLKGRKEAQLVGLHGGIGVCQVAPNISTSPLGSSFAAGLALPSEKGLPDGEATPLPAGMAWGLSSLLKILSAQTLLQSSLALHLSLLQEHRHAAMPKVSCHVMSTNELVSYSRGLVRWHTVGLACMLPFPGRVQA